MTDSPTQSAVIVHFDHIGNMNYVVIGGEAVRLFIVDDRAPDDRVYEWTPRNTADEFRAIIPEGVSIGSSQDERHPAIEARIMAAQEGRPHLAAVATPAKEPTDG